MLKPLDVINSGTQICLLRELSIHSDTELNETQLAELCRCTRQTVSTNLDLLAEEDLLVRRKIGNMNLIRLNKENIFYKTIKELFDLETHLKKELVDSLKERFKVDTNIFIAYLFGSVVRGEDKTDSDIDLFVVAKNERQFTARYFEWLEELGRKFGKRFSTNLKAADTIGQLTGDNSPLLHNIAKEGIKVGGYQYLTVDEKGYVHMEQDVT